MAENWNQPNDSEAVLGETTPEAINSNVLGGIEEVKSRLASGNAEQQIAALSEALNYGQEGIELLIRALKHESMAVRFAAYSLLLKNLDPELKPALQKYRPYSILKHLHTLINHWPGHIAFSPDGTTLAASGSNIELWDVHTFQLRGTLTGSAQCLAFSPDGTTLASGSKDTTIRLWDVRTGQLRDTLIGHSNHVTCLAFSPDGTTLASGSEDTTIRLWDVHTCSLINTLSNSGVVRRGVAFSPDGQILASIDGICMGRRSILKLWDAHTGELQAELSAFDSTRNYDEVCVTSVTFSPDGTTLASSCEEKLSRRSSNVKLWDLSARSLKRSFPGFDRYHESLVFSADGMTLAGHGYQNMINLWDPGTGLVRSTRTGASESVCCIAFSPDGMTLASAGENKPSYPRPGHRYTLDLWQIENPNHHQLDPVEFFHRYRTLKEAVKSEEAGLEAVIEALKDESLQVQELACLLLKENPQLNAKQALQMYWESLPLSSAAGMNYTRLRDLLAAEKWQEADAETEAVMLRIAERVAEGFLRVEDIEKFPEQDLHTIDRLWLRYSSWGYGFSVQKQIWESVLGGEGSRTEVNCNAVNDSDEFELRIGWAAVMSKGADYHGANDEYLGTATIERASGYFPREISRKSIRWGSLITPLILERVQMYDT